MNKLVCTAMLLVTVFLSLAYCQDETDGDEGDPLSRTFYRPSSRGARCTFEGQRGVCTRRNRCSRPSGALCRWGIVPIVCCITEPERVEVVRPSRTTTTAKPKSTTTTEPPKPIVHPKPGNVNGGANDEYVDIVFPGCGNRYPTDPNRRPTVPSNNGRRWNRPAGGLLGRTLGRKKRGLIDIDPVIVGGVTAKKNSWPWMVAIYRKTASSQIFLCGASLISKRYVLTAAHCFRDGAKSDPSKLVVLVGGHDTKEKDGDWYDVQKILVHPGYVQRQYYNDITLLTLDKPVVLSSKVNPVCLPSPSLRSKLVGTKRNVTVTGWGDTNFGGKRSKVLQEVELPIVPVKRCNTAYSKIASDPFPRGINDLFICAGIDEGGKDACQGDSGGPLVMQMSDSNYIQLGIVSFGYNCAEAGFPGVYTRISKFTKWIRDNTDLG